MSSKAKKGQALPIGIDMGSTSLKIAQLRPLPGGQYSLLAATSAEFPPEIGDDAAKRARFLTDTISEVRKAYPFQGRQCILSLPASMTFVQHLKMAKMPPEQVAQSLQWELQGKLPFDATSGVIRHIVAGEAYVDNELKQELIVFAARREAIEQQLAAVNRANLECAGVNVDPCAIVECFARLFRRADDANHATLFVDIGSASTQMVITHGQRLVFAKNLAFGGDQFDEALAATLNISTDEAHRRRTTRNEDENTDAEAIEQALIGTLGTLSEEMTNCLRYYDSVFSDRPVERVVFLGGQAFDKKLCQSLAQRLALPAQIGDPLAQIGRDMQTIGEDTPGAPESRPDWAVAVGLSLGAAIKPEAYSAA